MTPPVAILDAFRIKGGATALADAGEGVIPYDRSSLVVLSLSFAMGECFSSSRRFFRGPWPGLYYISRISLIQL